jgi:hypothetical protein
MPYLTVKDKEEIKNSVDYLSDTLERKPIESFVGYINYLNFVFVRRWIKKNGKKYFVFASIIGTLICCILEIYRRLVAPYEEEKIISNGDVE